MLVKLTPRKITRNDFLSGSFVTQLSDNYVLSSNYCRHKTCHPLPQRRRRDDGKERGPVFVTFYFVTAFMYAPQDEVNRNAEMFSLITLYSKSVTNLTKLKQFNFLSPPVIYFFDLYPPSLTLGNKPSNERKVMTLSLLSLCSTFFSPA